MFVFTVFPDIKADDVPEEVKEKIRALKKIREDLQAAMSEVGEDKVGSHVHSYIVESTMCMNMAVTMLKDMSNVAKRQNKMIQEKNGIIQDKDGVITKMKSKLNIFNKIKKTQEKFKSDKNFTADCSYCDKKKGQLTNAHNYMEHMMYKHLLE